MSNENLTNEICKKCGEKLKEEEKIYGGYCEKCWNKWIKKKEKRPNEKEEPINAMESISYICGLLSITLIIMLSIIMFLSVANPISLIMSIIKSFSNMVSNWDGGVGNSTSDITTLIEVILSSIYTKIAVISSIVLGSIGTLLGGVSIKKYGKNKFVTAGTTMSIIGVILAMILYLIVYN